MVSFSYHQGNEAWVENLESKFHKEFKAAPSIQWVTAGEGRVAGEVRSAGGSGFGAGNVTFVNVYEAGCVLLWVLVFSFLLIACLPIDIWYHMTNQKQHW